MDPQQQAPATDPQQQVAQQLKGANNVLVTVSASPSVDQLAAAIGTTLVLNKLGKHATCVFSGQIPSTIEFLQPEKTFEKTTDSLRDFIIALDKSKADKLRYKVEDKYVKIFITPYHTSLGEKDLEFSQGDFNVDVVLAIGVKKREELDQAIMAHGRILHDAAVVAVNTVAGAEIGAINLTVADASSLSEAMVNILDQLKEADKPLYDQQIATALLTGIVAETNRFSNAKTTPRTMSTAAQLMNAGANQQLIATKLEEPKPVPKEPLAAPKAAPIAPKPVIKPPPASPAPAAPKMEAMKRTKTDDGTLEVPHESQPEFKLPQPDTLPDEEPEQIIDRIHIDDEGQFQRMSELEKQKAKEAAEEGQVLDSDQHRMVDGPPTMGGKLSANTEPEKLDPATDPLAGANVQPLLQHDQAVSDPLSPTPDVQPGPGSTDEKKTLQELEKQVNSPHLDPPIIGVKPGGTLGVDLPPQLVGQDTGLPTDLTAGQALPGAPPPVPPPLPATPPPQNGNLSDPNSGVPL